MDWKKLQTLKKWMGETEAGIKIIIGGDFDARTEKEGEGITDGRERDGRKWATIERSKS